jgi:hypothetical protein
MVEEEELLLRVAEKWLPWEYTDMTGEGWDAQPACFLTDYFLAIQSFLCAYLLNRKSSTMKTPEEPWYIAFFVSSGIVGVTGGFLHHLAYEIYRQVLSLRVHDPFPASLVLFGHKVDGNRLTFDFYLSITWRLVLALYTLNNYLFFGLVIKKYFTQANVPNARYISGVIYTGLCLWAVVTTNPSILLIGYLPVMVFGIINLYQVTRLPMKTTTTIKEGKSFFGMELVAYLNLFFGAIIQGIRLSPSDDIFNHNSLCHAFVSCAVLLLYWQCLKERHHHHHHHHHRCSLEKSNRKKK